MGVTRLWSYIKNNRVECVEHVDFVQMAQNTPGGIKLLVDFYSWEHFMKTKFLASLEKKTNNPYLCFCGGEYSAINDYVASFVKTLRSINVELIFYLDGSKGSSELGTKEKWNTWIQRHMEDTKMMRQIMRVLNREIPIEALELREITRPCLQEIQNITTLQKLGCEMHFAASGEADTYIARRMQEDKSVVGVFSNDTDFCIFPGSRLINEHFFDENNDLKIVNESMRMKKPEKLMCGLISSDALWRHFKFPSVHSLCDLAILAGNDFTLPILNQIGPYRGLVGRIAKIADTVREFGTAENSPMLGSLMKDDHRLIRAVHHSREFYSLNLPEETYGNDALLTVSNAIKEGRCPSTIFAMCKRFYWHRMIMEDTEQSINTAEQAMVFIRSYIYSLLLPPNEDRVHEFGRSAMKDFEQMTALKIRIKRLPTLDEVQKNSFQKNRALFHSIMSHQEHYIPTFNRGFFRQFGNKLGFICYLLRYFLLQNWQQNLRIAPGEFLILCAWLLRSQNAEHYMRNTILPMPRCITIENWILCMYRTTCAFLGSLLNLSKEFPTPADLFSGAVWVSFYTASDLGPEYKHQSQAYQQLSFQEVRTISRTVTDILKERQNIVESIVQGVFPVHL